MQDRQHRFIIPATITLISTILTLWFFVGLDQNPLRCWFQPSCSTQQTELSLFLDFLIPVGVTNLGLGYICNILFTLWMMSNNKERFVDFERFIYSFHLEIDNSYKDDINKSLRKLLAEFHLRFHSHAPQTLIDFCTRRNTAWYTAKTCSIAFAIGWLFAIAIIWSNKTCLNQMGLAIFISALMVIVFPFILWRQGTRWNEEFWEVAWKWIEWDIDTHPLPDDWSNCLPKGVKSK
jgi:hypothetical protein